jgi:hypothetical protein
MDGRGVKPPGDGDFTGKASSTIIRAPAPQACAAARLRGLRLSLEVLDHDRGAIALYERQGWRRVATVPAEWARAGGGQTLLYYIAPE